MNTTTSYLNPVYRHTFADPFVLKYCGEYWAYASCRWHDDRWFGILHSTDLVNWHAMPGAMEPLPEGWTEYWAPEVSYDNGRFYMYYSVGNEERMEIRVAVADHPAGPFIDSGKRLTDEEFAIDAHVFVDDDGTRYLFYATDFLDHSHVGTGTVRDRLIDPFTLARDRRPVALPKYDWHVFDPQRKEKGGVRWHTVEGSFVLKRKDRYYHMFSGGNWKNISYGVSYAVTDRIDRADEWEQRADGERVLPILRTIPDKVIGPGHNSVVRGPDNMQRFCVYHRWADDLSGRLMAIDPLDWAGERIIVQGPSTTPQPVPNAPTVAGFGNDESFGDHWRAQSGDWTVQGGVAAQRSDQERAHTVCDVPAEHFVAEVSLKAIGSIRDRSMFGVSLLGEQGDVLRCLIAPAQQRMIVAWQERGRWHEDYATLPPHFDPTVYHLLRIVSNHQRVSIALDDVVAQWHGRLASELQQIALTTDHTQAAFAGFALTVGWQDLFAYEQDDPAAIGWQPSSGEGCWHVTGGQLHQTDARSQHAMITKGPLLSDYEVVINGCSGCGSSADGCWGFYPASHPDDPGPLLRIVREHGNYALVVSGTQQRSFPLPDQFDITQHQQFRVRRQGGKLDIRYEAHELGTINILTAATNVALYAHTTTATFDMVRVTAIRS